ncbi:MAG: DUF971 domain-containing protein, partial [Porticoccaceae bacterium]
SLLELCWSDGAVDTISEQNLRRYCACSGCRAKKQVGVELVTDSATVVDLLPMGTTGVQIRFSDGHDRGIYPWAYLRAIAQGNAREFVFE